MAVFEAYQLGELKTTSLEDEAVRAFLKTYRQKAALDKWTARKAAKKIAQEEGGLVWVEEEEDDDEEEGGYDALGVSETFQRPTGALSDREYHSRGSIQGRWAARAERSAPSSSEVEGKESLILAAGRGPQNLR